MPHATSVGLSYESTVAALIKDGAAVECVYMEEGNTAMASGGAIVKGAPNLPAAQAMMDLLASAEFQDRRAAESSGRGSNKNCNLLDLPKESEFNMIPLDFEYLSENKAAMIDKWNQLWAETH
jgi:iron(III) transport system substrate-binding protein